MAAAGHPVAVVRLAVKTAWEDGTLTYLNRSGCWNAENRAFALTADVHPSLDTAADRTYATRTLIEAYFDRYGPATIKDAMWWSALSRSAVTTAPVAFNQIGEVLPTVLFDGRVRGTWAWSHRTLTTSATLARPETVAGLARATGGLTEALRAGWRDRTLPAADPDQFALPI